MTNTARISPYSIYYHSTLPRFVEPIVTKNNSKKVKSDTSRLQILSCAGREHVLVEVNRYLLNEFHDKLSEDDKEFLELERIGNTYIRRGDLFLISLPGILAIGFDTYGSDALYYDLHRASVHQVEGTTDFLRTADNLYGYAAAVNSAVPTLANPLLSDLTDVNVSNAMFIQGNNQHLTATLSLSERSV